MFKILIWALFYLGLPGPVPNLALCPGDCLCDNTRLIVNCTDVYLPDMPITLNPHIKSMRINYAGLERIETNLQFYPALIICDLSHNRLASLNPYAFETQSHLSRLAVTHNRISTVYKESLTGLNNLQSLDISHNKLTHLGPNLFLQLHRLTDLDLSGNSIGSIHRLAFQVKNIFFLYIYELCSLLYISFSSNKQPILQNTHFEFPQFKELSSVFIHFI